MRSRTAQWFICKIRYEKVMEDGLQKKVTEQYVINTAGFAEAEKRIMEEMGSYISGVFEVVEIDRCVFKEIFFMDLMTKMVDVEANELLKAANKKDKKTGKEIMDRNLDTSIAHTIATNSIWYKSKVQFITIDEKTEKEKRSNIYYLVEGASLESARNNIDKVMGGTMIDYIISSVSETKIEDVFEYKAQNENKD